MKYARAIFLVPVVALLIVMIAMLIPIAVATIAVGSLAMSIFVAE